MREPPVKGRLDQSRRSANSRISSSRVTAQRQSPELGRRLQAYCEALILWRADPTDPPPQPRYFLLQLPDMTPEGLERWRRGDG